MVVAEDLGEVLGLTEEAGVEGAAAVAVVVVDLIEEEASALT